jgi:xanthine/uracil permease
MERDSLGRQERRSLPELVSIILAAIAYVVIGVGAAALAGAAASKPATTAWRLTAWVLSIVVFGIHLGHSRLRRRVSLRTSAFQVAVAVALGAFVLAAVGPVRTHWGRNDTARVALLSLAAWPIMTGLPAFIAALVGGYLIERTARRSPETPA